MEKLKVGQSFEVAKWVTSPFGPQEQTYVNSHGIIEDVILLTQHINGKSCNRFVFFDDEIKVVGRLTITKVK